MIRKITIFIKPQTFLLSQITGLETNVNFLIDLARHEYFQKGDVHTGFIPQHFDTLFQTKTISNEILAQAAIGLIVNENNSTLLNSFRAKQLNDPFTLNTNFRVNSSEVRTLSFINEGKEEKVSVTQSDEGFRVKVNDGEWRNVSVKTVGEEGRFTLKINMNGSVLNFSVVITPEIITIFNEDGKTELEIKQSKFLTSADEGGSDKSSLTAPMPGIVDKIFVNVGDEVKPGQSIAVIIAMKMEYVLKATAPGVVKSITAKVGDNIKKGFKIVEIGSN